MNQIKLESLEKFHSVFRAIRSHDGLGHWFRGQSDSSWSLLPKAGRKEYFLPENRDLGRFNDWCNHAIAYCDLPDSILERLAIAQHHGLATRLLDWTMNPLVAAFFCCIENPSIEGAIYGLEVPKTHIGNNANIESIKELSGVLGYMPKSVTPRVMTQKGLFTIHCDASRGIEVSESSFAKNTKSLTKVVISPELKKEVLQMLDDYGINSAALFPDLDGLSRHINRKTTSFTKRS